MPRKPVHILIWSSSHSRYDLYTQGQLEQTFVPGEEVMWQSWLEKATSFAFQGACGNLNVYWEARPRGGRYWYAYAPMSKRTRKRYLGRTETLSLAQLEETARALVPQRQPAEAFDQGMELLSTKLAPPRLPNALVLRERLLADLEHALSTPLTLLSTWVSRYPYQVAWLSLDELDNTPMRFWVSIIEALRRCRPGIATLALAMWRSPQPPPVSAILTALLNELAEVSTQKAPLLLILDDYQVLTDPNIEESLLFWLEHLPAHVHLLLSSRVDPDLPLSRFRARGQLTEIRADDLHFQPQEVSTFLQETMGLALSEEEVLALYRRTEGWIAGLQLAALSLRKQQDRSAWIATFTGSHRFVLDYVQQEVLKLQPQPIQRFLLQAAVLTRMNAALCQAVTGEPASQDILETLERSNLFVVPLDEQRQWYRLHDLFREALLAQMHAAHPDLLRQAHQRAASWYEAEGALREAIPHRLSAEDFPSAATLMERAAEQAWMAGDAKTVHAWVTLLPDQTLSAHLPLACNAVLYVSQSLFGASEERLMAAVGQTIARAERLLREADLPETEAMRLRKHTELFHLWRDFIQAILSRNTAALRQYSQQMQFLIQEDEGNWQLVPLLANFIFCVHTLEDCHFLRPLFLKAQQQAQREHKRYEWLRMGQYQAQASWEAGEARQAQRECQEILSLLQPGSEQNRSIAGYLHLTLARVLWAQNQQEEAHAHLTSALLLAQNWQYMGVLMECYDMQVTCALEQGDLVKSEQILQEVRRLTQGYGIALVPPNVMGAQVRLWLAQGDLATAGAWAAHYPLQLDALESVSLWEEHLAVARVYLAQQRYAQALPVLARLLTSAEQGKRRGKVACILAFQVAALSSLQECEQARARAVRLLRLTEPEGFVRVYLEAGEPMRQMLLTLLEVPHEEGAPAVEVSLSYLSALLQAFEHKEHKLAMRAGTSLTGGEEASLSSAQSGSSTPSLSRQEIRVLRLLIAGRTYTEMAEELVVSLNTVKTQVSSIYHKLGVSRRAEAIAEASRLHLL